MRDIPLHMSIISTAVRQVKSKQSQARINPGFALYLPNWFSIDSILGAALG